jgi:hypothetical protein
MEEMQALQIRFPARLLAARRDDRGVLYQLVYRTDNETYVIHHDDPEGPPWLEDGAPAGSPRLISGCGGPSWPTPPHSTNITSWAGVAHLPRPFALPRPNPSLG